ncbi:hypothetical protein [Ottowia sp. VDI28]|uniref:hypothetical protein n=1 Tax=Ottowia sp. VDI28 TaxID=3133968 RepID=UPI003C2F7493
MAGTDSRLSKIILASLCLALSACGGDDASAPAPPPAPTPTPAPAPGAVKSVSLVAGGGAEDGGSCGSADGLGADARLGYARDMAVANDGTVYVLEDSCPGTLSTPQRVRSITASGQVTTVATGFAGTLQTGELPPSFQVGGQLAVADSGAVYLSEVVWDGDFLRPVYSPGMASGVWKITPTGAQAFAGLQSQSMSPIDGQGLNAKFDRVQNMVFGQGALIITEYGGTTIRKVTEDAVVTTMTLPYRPDMADNTGELYQRTGDWFQGQGVLTRFDGQVIPVPGLTYVFAISSDGTVYGIKLDTNGSGYRPYRRKADGTTELIKGPDGGAMPPWDSSSHISVSNLRLDREGNLYVAHGYQIWKVSFYK